jgi:hypothetical protein
MIRMVDHLIKLDGTSVKRSVYPVAGSTAPLVRRRGPRADIERHPAGCDEARAVLEAGESGTADVSETVAALAGDAGSNIRRRERTLLRDRAMRQMARRKRQKDPDAVVEALYRVRDSDKVTHLIKPFTPNERTEVWKRVGERVDADKAQFESVPQAERWER